MSIQADDIIKQLVEDIAKKEGCTRYAIDPPGIQAHPDGEYRATATFQGAGLRTRTFVVKPATVGGKDAFLVLASGQAGVVMANGGGCTCLLDRIT